MANNLHTYLLMAEEYAHITSYEDGWDAYEGPIWHDPLNAKAVAAQMKEIHEYNESSTRMEDTEDWDCDSEEIGGYEDGWDGLNGPAWDDPLDAAAVAKQMRGEETKEEVHAAPEHDDVPHLEAEYEDGLMTPDSELPIPLHRCSIDPLSRTKTEDLVAAAEALYMISPHEKPLALCSHCGSSSFTHISLKERMNNDEEAEIYRARDYFDENGIQW